MLHPYQLARFGDDFVRERKIALWAPVLRAVSFSDAHGRDYTPSIDFVSTRFLKIIVDHANA